MPDRPRVPLVPQRFSTLRTPAPAPEIPPPPKVPTVTQQPNPWSLIGAAPKWAIGVVVVLLLGGSTLQGIATILASKGATSEQLTAVHEQQKVDSERITRIEKKLDTVTGRSIRRDRAHAGLLCRLNGDRPTPFARGVDCDELVWDPPPLGSSTPWRAREEYPNE